MSDVSMFHIMRPTQNLKFNKNVCARREKPTVENTKHIGKLTL
jgi:hypothetical protein